MPLYTMIPMAHVSVRDRDYNVYISLCLNTRRLHIFKYNDVSCQYDVFDDQADACLFIEEPLPRNHSKQSPKNKR